LLPGDTPSAHSLVENVQNVPQNQDPRVQKMTEVVEGFDAKTVKQLPNFFPQSEAGLHVLAKIT
jgi:hypothetical protein